MSLLSIAYVSASVSPMSEEDIREILTQARANNERTELTGALLYHGGRFAQILEGPAEAVAARFDVISADPRHRVLQKVREVIIPERQFPEWTMGFKAHDDDAATRLPGFENFFARSGRSRLEHADNEAQQFLEWLGEYWLPPR